MLIALLLLFTVLNSVTSNLTYQILVHQPNSPQKNYIGKLYLTILNEHHTIEARVENDGKKLIQGLKQSELANNPLIVEFVPIKSEYLEYTKRVYRTSLTEFANYNYGEKIAIVVGSDLKNLHINSINYVQTRDRVDQIYSDVVFTQMAEFEPFKYVFPPKKTKEEENESFFSKYKWPLIIGGVLVYTMMTVDPEKAGQQAQK